MCEEHMFLERTLTMSTRSYILMQNEDGSLDGIYCHFDGSYDYPLSVGVILDKYYQDPNRVKQLIRLGDLSSIGAEISPGSLVEKYGHWWNADKHVKNLPHNVQNSYYALQYLHCSAYYRDWHQGDKPNIAHFASFDDFLHSADLDPCIEYFYLMRPSKSRMTWFVMCDETKYKFKTLKHMIELKDEH